MPSSKKQSQILSRLSELKKLHNSAASLTERIFPHCEDMPSCFEHMDAFTDAVEQILLERLTDSL